jgi:hypothetical protein
LGCAGLGIVVTLAREAASYLRVEQIRLGSPDLPQSVSTVVPDSTPLGTVYTHPVRQTSPETTIRSQSDPDCLERDPDAGNSDRR